MPAARLSVDAVKRRWTKSVMQETTAILILLLQTLCSDF
jgi:hypothetical protein